MASVSIHPSRGRGSCGPLWSPPLSKVLETARIQKASPEKDPRLPSGFPQQPTASWGPRLGHIACFRPNDLLMGVIDSSVDK